MKSVINLPFLFIILLFIHFQNSFANFEQNDNCDIELKITTYKPGFIIILDGKIVDFTPFIIKNISCASHELIITASPKPEYMTEKKVEKAGDKKASFIVKSDLADVNIKFDNLDMGDPPTKVKNVTTGKHILEILNGNEQSYRDASKLSLDNNYHKTTNISKYSNANIAKDNSEESLTLLQKEPSFIEVTGGFPYVIDILMPGYSASVNYGIVMGDYLYWKFGFKSVFGTIDNDKLSFDSIETLLGLIGSFSDAVNIRAGIGAGGLLLYTNYNIHSWNVPINAEVALGLRLFSTLFLGLKTNLSYGIKKAGNKPYIVVDPNLALYFHF